MGYERQISHAKEFQIIYVFHSQESGIKHPLPMYRLCIVIVLQKSIVWKGEKGVTLEKKNLTTTTSAR